MTATRFVAIPCVRSSDYFGQRLPVISQDQTYVRVAVQEDEGRREIRLPLKTVNVVSDHTINDMF